MNTPAPPSPPSPVSPAGTADPALRREQRGWYWYDWAHSAFNTTVTTVFLGPYLTTIAQNAAGARGTVGFLGLELEAKAYYPTIVSLSVVTQVVVMLAAGALADHTGRKKELLGFLAYLGAAATLGFYLLSGDRYVLGGVLFIVANTCFGAATVVYDSFLPQIATAEDRDRVSSRGWAFGYLGGGLLLAINLVVYLAHDPLGVDEGLAVRVSLASAGLWWGLFAVIPLLRLRNRPPTAAQGRAGGAQAIAGSLRQLGRTVAELRRYPRTLLFLVAYLVYNDGVQTVISFSATYAEHELGLSKDVQISAILMVQFVAFGGALLLGRLAERLGTKRTVLGALAVWSAVVGAAYLLQAGAAAQFYALAFLIAIVMGGTQALSRSLYSLVIPPGKEAEYFGLYQVSDRGSAFLGSAVIAVALQATGDYRAAVLSLLVFFVAGFALLLAVDLPRAVREAGNPVPRHL